MSYYIEYYKEKDTNPMVFLQRFRCTTEPIGGGTEPDEEGELVSWDAAVAAIKIAMKQLGWHPASEKSDIKNGETIIILFRHPISGRLLPWETTYNGELPFDAEWWCYPPKEE